MPPCTLFYQLKDRKVLIHSSFIPFHPFFPYDVTKTHTRTYQAGEVRVREKEERKRVWQEAGR